MTRRGFLKNGLPLILALAPESPTAADPPSLKQAVALQLAVNYEPIDKPSLFIVLEANGAASLTLHRTSTVLERRGGVIAPGDRARLESAAAQSSLLSLLRSKRVFEVEEEEYFKDTGYSLRIRTGRGFNGILAGYPRDSPAVLLAFIRQIEDACQALPKANLADAYIRCNPVEPSRLKSMKATGRVAIVRTQDLPEHSRYLVRMASSKIREFIPITAATLNTLSASMSPHRHLVLMSSGTAVDCYLYPSSKRL